MILIFLGLIGSLVLYLATGSKASLLLLPMTFCVISTWKEGPGFLYRTLFSLIIIIFALILIFPNDGLFNWAKSIVLVRIIGSSGWVASKYLEYFGNNAYTYYSHIGPVNYIYGNYPYGDYLLGQMIGMEYSGSSEANFNGSFWASDGFAAAGIWGIGIVTMPVIILLYYINKNAVGLDSRFTVAWYTGFFIAVLNVPLSTSLLSGGGLIIIILTRYMSKDKYYLEMKTKNN